MSGDEDRARLRDDEERELFAIRREEREMAATEKEMERELDVVAADEREAERRIEAEWRVEDWGRDPPRPPAWRTRTPRTNRRAR